MVTARKLRRAAHRNPLVVKAAAATLAGAVGLTTAAYGVFHIIEPYKGNGIRSEAAPAEEEPTTTDIVMNSALDIVFAQLPEGLTVVDEPLYSLPEATDLVTSIVDGTQPAVNGVVNPGGDDDGGNGGNNGLLPWGGTITPPGGGGGGGTNPKDPTVPGVSLGPALGGVPTVPDTSCGIAPPPGLAPELGTGGQQAADEAPADEAESGSEAPADGADGDGEDAPAEETCDSTPVEPQL